MEVSRTAKPVASSGGGQESRHGRTGAFRCASVQRRRQSLDSPPACPIAGSAGPPPRPPVRRVTRSRRSGTHKPSPALRTRATADAAAAPAPSSRSRKRVRARTHTLAGGARAHYYRYLLGGRRLRRR